MALAVSVLAVVPALAQDRVLNVYNWSDYIGEDLIKKFEAETGIKVRYDNFDNNVHAKLVAGKTGYDIVVPSSNWAKLQIDGGLLRKLDKAQIPNLKNVDPAVAALGLGLVQGAPARGPVRAAPPPPGRAAPACHRGAEVLRSAGVGAPRRPRGAPHLSFPGKEGRGGADRTENGRSRGGSACRTCRSRCPCRS